MQGICYDCSQTVHRFHTMVASNVNITSRDIAEFCRKHHIRRLSFFGSVVRNDFKPESDVDCLVEFEEGHHPGWSIIDLEQEFSQLVDARDVQFVNPKYLNRHLKERILSEAEEQYAERSLDDHGVGHPDAGHDNQRLTPHIRQQK